MGEAVVSSEELVEMKQTERKKEGMEKWERFLPRMDLRVLLVEADDSTRQIVTALLRKSCYRVTAVPDGLSAWEILKGRLHNIDLILTEVDLPSISGFSLLTLIMEHEICKNIPVIMMSSQDSVSTVYKCMMRGAADYLVKPVRRNELRNLWQHVWRRQSSTVGGNIEQDESVGQQKIEATFENGAASDHSSGYMASIQRKEEYIEKGSDAQSTCTKPEFEAESEHMEDIADLSRQLWEKSLANEVTMQNHEACANYGQKSLVPVTEAQVSEVAACNHANANASGEDIEPESQRRDVIHTIEACNALVTSSRRVIDFMGTFNNHDSTSNNGASKFDSSPQLDLSLRRSHPSNFENQVTEQKFTLRHSNASAFTRYTNKPYEPMHSTLSGVCNQQKELGTGSEKNFSSIVAACNSDTPVATLTTQRSISSLAVSYSKQSELPASCPQQRVCHVPGSVNMNLDNLCTSYGSVLPRIFCTQPALSPIPSPSSASLQETSFQVNPKHCSNVEYSNGAQLYDQLGEKGINSTNDTVHKQGYKLDSLEDLGHISPATDQSASSSFCNGALRRLNSMGYGSTSGSNSNVDQVAVGRAAAAESKNDEGFLPSNGNSQRSIQREAALTKFRLKRKDRCYDKKVRYESRKKLAEQRPRLKGQFVRQVQPEATPSTSENHCSISFDG